jgi:hypothetical protein
MELLHSIENTGLGIWVRESGSLWAYPTIIFLHSVGLSLVVGFSAVIDLRLLGVAPRVPLAPLEKLFPLMWSGVWLTAISGVALLVADASTFLLAPLMYFKLGVVALGVVNLAMIRRRVFANPAVLEGRVPPRARALAVTSLVLWTAAMTAGRMTAYIGPAFL